MKFKKLLKKFKNGGSQITKKSILLLKKQIRFSNIAAFLQRLQNAFA